jgi:hypothetical protein
MQQKVKLIYKIIKDVLYIKTIIANFKLTLNYNNCKLEILNKYS